jgi:hypothetical protein
MSKGFDREKMRLVVVPIATWKSCKRASAELERPMSVLLAGAWKAWSEQNIENTMVLTK